MSDDAEPPRGAITGEGDRLGELFDALIGLDAAARARALDEAGLPPARRAELEALLAADASADTRIERALGGGAARLRGDLASAAATGATIGAWRIERELGAGGMGTVFLVRRADAGDEQRGALKLLRGFPTEEARQRLRQERRVLATLEHPYIARLLDGGETPDGQPYFVMEYVEGEPASVYAARHALDARARVALVDRIAEAVAHAHQRLVIHRDLKPANVLVRADGSPRVLDFGVAKLVDAAGDGDRTSTRVWTPGYASPEQRRGGAVTTATDVYALGVLLQELLTGRRPSGAPCEPALAPVGIDADLRGIVAMATAEEPAARYATVEALRDDLARWRDGRPVRAARDSALYRARKFVRRHRGGAGFTLLLLLVLAGFVWRLSLERDRALAAEALAEQRRLAAEQAARTARGALDFFAGVLAEIAPERTATRTLTLDDWLARAAARLARERPAGSAETALLGGYLGMLHGSLGEAAQAIARLEPALTELEARGLGEGAMYAGLATSLASELLGVGRLEESALWSRKGAAAWRGLAADGLPEAPLLAAQAEAYAHYALGEYDQAAARFRAALDLPAQDPREPQIRDVRAELGYMLGSSLGRLGRYAEALAAVDAALAEVEAADAGSTTLAARLLRTRTELLTLTGRPAEALAAVDRALAIDQAIFGGGGKLRARLLGDRGSALNQLGRYAEARAAYEEAQRLALAVNGHEDPVLGVNLGNLCDSIGDNACARDVFRRVLDDPAALRTLPPAQHRQIRQMLGRALSQDGDYAQARAVLEAVLQEAIAEDGADSPNAAAILLHLARNEQRDRRWEAALDYARRARAAFTGSLPPEHPVFASLDRIEGYVALGQGRRDEAARLIEGHHAATVAGDGTDSLWASLAALDVAALRHAQGRDDEARALLRQHLRRVREAVLPTHPDRAAAERLARRLGLAVEPDPA